MPFLKRGSDYVLSSNTQGYCLFFNFMKANRLDREKDNRPLYSAISTGIKDVLRPNNKKGISIPCKTTFRNSAFRQTAGAEAKPSMSGLDLRVSGCSRLPCDRLKVNGNFLYSKNKAIINDNSLIVAGFTNRRGFVVGAFACFLNRYPCFSN